MKLINLFSQNQIKFFHKTTEPNIGEYQTGFTLILPNLSKNVIATYHEIYNKINAHWLILEKVYESNKRSKLLLIEECLNFLTLKLTRVPYLSSDLK